MVSFLSLCSCLLVVYFRLLTSHHTAGVSILHKCCFEVVFLICECVRVNVNPCCSGYHASNGGWKCSVYSNLYGSSSYTLRSSVQNHSWSLQWILPNPTPL